MKRILLLVTLSLATAAAAAAQTHRTHSTTAVNSDTSAQASARQGEHAAELAAGTHLAAQLQQTLDVRKSHVGDEVVLKTTQAIKQNGHTVVNKGARLVGHVTDVQQRAQGNAESRISLLFDRLESGSLSTPISATITSVTQAAAHTSVADDDLMSDTSAGTTTTARGGASSSGGGGLLGGVGSTAGGVVGGVTTTAGNVVNTTTQATGEVVSSTTGAVGGTTRGVGQTVRGLRISQSAGASAEGGSTLALTGGNLRLEKNTTFMLTLNESANVGREHEQ